MRTIRLSKKIFTISNLLSLSRIAMAPFIVMGLVSGRIFLVLGLFVLASLTDLLDGYFARLFNEPTVLGTYLDPLADKVLLLSCFGTLAVIHFPSLPLPWWFIVLVFARETVIVVGAVALLFRKPRTLVTPTRGGKLTTVGYMILIMWIIICRIFLWMPLKTFYFVLTGVTILALFSLAEYVWRGVQWLRSVARS